MAADYIYKIATKAEWRQAERNGRFEGAPIDLADGFIHFSTAAQLCETAAKHFSGKRDLLLMEVDARMLGDRLRYEPSRGGQLFPHLYASLPLDAVRRKWELVMNAGGDHEFPVEIGA